MVVRFNGYRLVTTDGVSANSDISINDKELGNLAKSYEFDEKKFNQLITQRKYNEAADYAAQYHFDNAKKQEAHENYIENLRRDGRRLSAFYSNVAPEDMDAIDFNMGVFEDGGIDALSNNNKYKTKFVELKNNIGGNDATTLKVTFKPTKHYLFGIKRGFFDALYADNPYSIENFYDKIGMSAEELSEKGINITTEKGRPTITFDKAHPLANKILYNLPTGKVSYSTGLYNQKDAIEIEGLNNSKVVQDSNNVAKIDFFNIDSLKRLINETQNLANKYEQLDEDKVKVYSSTIGGLISPELEDLKKQYKSDKITAAQYRSALNTQYNEIIGTLKSIGSGGYQIYGNNGKEISDNTLRLLDNKERSRAIDMISNSDDITLESMVSNGQIGTLVTIGALEEEKKKIGYNPTYDDMTKSRRFQFFIPGLFTDLAQKQINRNTLTRAVQEINSMQDGNYEYQTVDGEKIKPDGRGFFNRIKGKTFTTISKDEAQTLINKDMAILDGKKIKYQFINDNDQLVNYNGYDSLVKQYAYNVVNELYPTIPLIDVYGNPITIDKAFENVSFLGTKVNDFTRTELSTEVSAKLNEFYNIYNSIINSTDYYVRNGKISY